MIYSYIGATYRLSQHSYFSSYHISNTDYKPWRNLAANWHSKVPYKILQEEKYGRHYLFKFLALRYSVPSNYEAFGFPSVLYVDVILLYLLNTPFNAHAYFL